MCVCDYVQSEYISPVLLMAKMTGTEKLFPLDLLLLILYYKHEASGREEQPAGEKAKLGVQAETSVLPK